MSVLPSAWNNWAPTSRIFMKFDIWLIFENLSRNFKFHSNLTRITGTLHEEQYIFTFTSRSVFPIMRNVPDKSWRENQNTHFVVLNYFFGNRAVIEIKCKNSVQPDRPQMTIKSGACVLHAAWLRLQTHTQNLQYFLLFHCNKWWNERASMKCLYESLRNRVCRWWKWTNLFRYEYLISHFSVNDKEVELQKR